MRSIAEASADRQGDVLSGGACSNRAERAECVAAASNTVDKSVVDEARQ